MAAFADVAQIRVIPVSAAGSKEGWTLLDQAIRDLSPRGFIAIDTEFSGLGADPRLEDKDISIRYEAMRELAETRAILSLGVSLFNPIEDKNGAAKLVELTGETAVGDTKAETTALSKMSASYSVTNLEFLLRCNSPFEIVSDAGAFLVAHGFDFNAMFSNGIGYIRASSEKVGKNEDAQSAFRWGPYPRGLLWRMGRAAVPVVLHNGLMDLVLMYTSFHGPLPKTLNGFVCKLLDCVPAGFWDTKLLATGPGEESVSFLHYVYARAVREGRVRVSNRKNLPPDETTRPVVHASVAKTELCALYAMRGYCNSGVLCGELHDPFMVVEGKLNGTLPTDEKAARKLYKQQSKKKKALERAKEEERKKKPKLNKKARARLVAAEQAEAAKRAPNSSGHARKRMRSEMGTNGSQAWPSDKWINSLPNLKLGELTSGGEPDGNGAVLEEAEGKELANETPRRSLNDQAHSAGWDAFCTGYAFANYRLRLSKSKFEGLRNRINLVKKRNPLLLCKSLFAESGEVENQGADKNVTVESIKNEFLRLETPADEVSNPAVKRQANRIEVRTSNLVELSSRDAQANERQIWDITLEATHG